MPRPTRQTQMNNARIEAEKKEAEALGEIRTLMTNVHNGMTIERRLVDMLRELPENSASFIQVLNVALGNIRKLNTNYLYQEHSLLETLVPIEEPDTTEEVEIVDDEE